MSFAIRGLRFRHSPAAPVLFDDLDLEIPAGERFVLRGPSGCGKSTLLHLLGLLLEQPLPAGVLRYRGSTEVDYAQLRPADRSALRLRSFGYVLQSCYLLPHFTGFENISMPLQLAGWPRGDALAYAGAVVRRLDLQRGTRLADAAAGMPRTMSGGERQRIAVLRAVIANPEVVFADEPSSNLDPENTTAFMDLLCEWQSGGLLGGLLNAPPDELPPSARERLASLQWRGHPRTLLLVCHQSETADRYQTCGATLRAGKAFVE